MSASLNPAARPHRPARIQMPMESGLPILRKARCSQESGWHELERNTIHAIAQAGRLGAIVEDMSEMASTAKAVDLGADQVKEAAVLRRFDCPLDRGPETRPTSPTFELGA
jgi:hypothetical protein